MTQEDKELLFQDLCARLPYYPKCEMIDEIRVVNNEKDSSYISTLFPRHIELFSYHNNFTIKPYLRPMSSMTEEERSELSHYYNAVQRTDFFYSHHIDCRFMIEKGLAIEVTEENNPYKE